MPQPSAPAKTQAQLEEAKAKGRMSGDAEAVKEAAKEVQKAEEAKAKKRMGGGN